MKSLNQRIRKLSVWQSKVDIQPLEGGITNRNFIVRDGKDRYFVRVGEDIPVHGVMRFNELAASRAAHEAGISPKVVHAEPGIMVLDYIDAKPMVAEQIREPENLTRILDLIRRCHQDIPTVFRGPGLVFWVFQVLRDYTQTLRDGSSRWQEKLGELNLIAEKLEGDVGKIDLVFGHNDLLAANFLDDGKRIWLVDWDYAGFNSPLFDLGGLASNNEFPAELEGYMLSSYFGKFLDEDLLKQYSAMKCASLLRETMWSMVSEIYSTIDFDYEGYTADNLAGFYKAWGAHQNSYSSGAE